MFLACIETRFAPFLCIILFSEILTAFAVRISTTSG